MTHNAAVVKFGSPYRINKEIESGNLYRLARGYYSDTQYVDPHILCAMRYPNSIVTMDSAFYLHGLTDRIPDKVHLISARGTTKISDSNVVQHFSEKHFLNHGMIVIKRNGFDIKIYNRERMLVELMRVSKSMPLDYYSELIGSYRKIVNELDLYTVEEFMAMFKRNKYMNEILQREVL